MENTPEIVTALQPLVIATFMSIVANRLTEGLIVPIWTKFNLDKFYLLYVAWAVAGTLVFITGVNIFADYIPDPMIGQILTAVVAGGGANLIKDIFGK